MAKLPPRSAGNGLTPTSPQRMTPAAPDSTKAPPAVHNPGHPAMKPVSEHTRPAAVTGPSTWDHGRSDSVFTPKGNPPLKKPSPDMHAHSDAQVTSTVGTNPNPPANRAVSTPADSTPRGGNPLSWQPYSSSGS